MQLLRNEKGRCNSLELYVQWDIALRDGKKIYWRQEMSERRRKGKSLGAVLILMMLFTSLMPSWAYGGEISSSDSYQQGNGDSSGTENREGYSRRGNLI